MHVNLHRFERTSSAPAVAHVILATTAVQQGGFLVLDRNFNQSADNATELLSNPLVADPAKGLRSLAAFDANADGRIDASDPVYAQLKVWQDLDFNGTASFSTPSDDGQGRSSVATAQVDVAAINDLLRAKHSCYCIHSCLRPIHKGCVPILLEGFFVEPANDVPGRHTTRGATKNG